MPTLLDDDQDQRKAVPSDDDAFNQIVGDNWSQNEQAKLRAEADAHKAATSTELKDAEGSGDKGFYKAGGDMFGNDGAAPNNGIGEGGLPKPSTAKKESRGKQFVGKIGASMKKHKMGWLIGGAAGLGLVTIIALVLLFLSTLLIPHFMQNLVALRFTQVARDFQDTNNGLVAEKVGLDTADQGLYDRFKTRYNSVRDGSWGKIDKLRPDKIVDNMEADGTLKYNYSEPSSVLGRRTITSIELNGETIPVNSGGFVSKITSPISSVTDRFRLRSDMSTSLEQSLDGWQTLIRGRTASEIRSRLGAKLFRWSDAEVIKDATETPEEADVANLKKSYEEATKNGAAAEEAIAGESVSTIADTAENATAQVDSCLQDPACAQKVVASEAGGLPDNALKAIEDGVGENITQKAVSALSTTYAIALPACIIYDGSIVKSGGPIDANNDSSMRMYQTLASAQDQQKTGHIDAPDLGALSRQLQGNTEGQTVNDSTVLLAARGQPIDTSASISTQSSASGDYTVFDAIPGLSLIANQANWIADKACPILTNVWVGLGTGLVLDVVAFFSGGSTEVLSQGATAAITAYAKHVAETFLTKDFVKSTIKIGAAVGGITLLAKLLVHQRMVSPYNGMSHGSQFANGADAGGVATAREWEAKQFAGRPMTNPEVAESGRADRRYLAEQNQKSSVYERYFAMDNSQSLASGIALRLSASARMSSLSSILTSVTRVLGSFSSPLQLFGVGQRALADGTVDNTHYGQVQYGWSQDEEDLFNNDPNYSHLVNAEKFDAAGDTGNTVASIYGPCFTDTIGNLLSKQKIVRNEDGSIKDDPNATCSPINLGIHNPTYGDLVFRYRVKVRWDNGLEHLTELANADTATASRPTTNTTTTTGNSGNGSVYVLGDSLTEGMAGQGGLQAKLQNAGWKTINISAACGRHLKSDGGGCTGGSILGGYAQADKDKALIQASDTIIVGLGTNDFGEAPAAYKADVQGLVNKIHGYNDKATVYWVSLFSTANNAAGKYPPLNVQLGDLEDAGVLHVIDWASVAAPYYDPNSIHPSAHYNEMANYVATQLGAAPK